MTNYKNWPTAISTGDTSLENFERFAKANVKGVEVSLRWFDWHRDWGEIAENAKKAGVEIMSYHLPFANEINIANLHDGRRQFAVTVHKELIANIAKHGVKRFVVHPSAEPIADEDRAESMKQAKKSLAEMAEFAAQFDAYVCVEDLPRTCLGHDVKEMVELVSAHDRLRVCFDVNHLLTIYGGTHLEFVKQLGDKIITTHMSDYDFIDERHYFAGEGEINWEELITAMEEADYNGPFLYEGGFDPSSYKPETPYGTIETAHERATTIKNYTGKK